MPRPKLPKEVRNEARINVSVLNKHKDFLNDFNNKSNIFRIIMFELMPKMIDLFMKNNIKANLSNMEIDIIKKYVEAMKDARI